MNDKSSQLRKKFEKEENIPAGSFANYLDAIFVKGTTDGRYIKYLEQFPKKILEIVDKKIKNGKKSIKHYKKYERDTQEIRWKFRVEGLEELKSEIEKELK